MKLSASISKLIECLDISFTKLLFNVILVPKPILVLPVITANPTANKFKILLLLFVCLILIFLV